MKKTKKCIKKEEKKGKEGPKLYYHPRWAQKLIFHHIRIVTRNRNEIEATKKIRLSKFCKEAGFMRVVEVGQYFVTKNANEFQHTIACREYTLPRDDKASEPKGWIRGNTRIGPVLEVTTSFQHFKYGIEVRIESVNKDNSHSWVRISNGTVRYVNDYIKHDTENLADPQEEEDVPTRLRRGCSQVEGESETSTEGIYWRDNHPTK